MQASSAIRAFRSNLLLLSFLCVAACGQSTTTSVNLHGVNYSADAFRYYLTDPDHPNSVAGGEMVEPFGAGGTMCCATLPKTWRPGIKLQVKAVWWVKKREAEKDKFEELKTVHTVEVPPYVDGKPGELWVVREKDGAMGIVASDYQPDHPKWPGKIKGWPVPSLEYRRERWAIHLHHQEGFVRTYIELLDQLQKDPVRQTHEAWNHALEYRPAELKGFSGPGDPNFEKYLRKAYTEELKETRQQVEELMKARP